MCSADVFMRSCHVSMCSATDDIHSVVYVYINAALHVAAGCNLGNYAAHLSLADHPDAVHGRLASASLPRFNF